MLRAGEQSPELMLRPAFGRAITLPDDLATGPVAIVFLGGLSTPDTRAAVAELQEVSAQMDTNGVRLVAVTTSAEDRVQRFVSRYHVLFPVVPDAGCTLRSAFGLAGAGTVDTVRGVARELARPGRHIKLGRGWIEPLAYAPAGCFVLGMDGRVSWSFEGIAFGAMTDAGRISSP